MSKSIAAYFIPANGTAAPAPVTVAVAAATSKRALTTSGGKAAAKEDVPPAKRTKVVATSGSPTVSIPKATTRADLRASLEQHPTILPLLELELETLGEDWLLALQDELTKPYFLKLKTFLASERDSKKQVFPPAEDIYSWSRLCPLKDIRVIIVGQDPYHDDGQAHLTLQGLAFSVRPGVKIPPSLRNMYKELAAEISGFNIPKTGDLTEWAKHGVLLLNSALTVQAHKAGSHASQGWDMFTRAVLQAVTTRVAGGKGEPGANGLVLMAWGAHAAKMIATLDTKRHLVLKSAHPSPLSASRGFFGNDHFKKSNEWLRERYGAGGGIDWKSLGA